MERRWAFAVEFGHELVGVSFEPPVIHCRVAAIGVPDTDT